MIMSKPLEKHDFFCISEDKKSSIVFSYIDLERDRYPSIHYRVHVQDDRFAGQVEIWIDQETLNRFVERLVAADLHDNEPISLKAMSEEEFELLFIHTGRGRYEVVYSIKRTRYSANRLIETTLSGSFDYGVEFLGGLREKLQTVRTLLA